MLNSYTRIERLPQQETSIKSCNLFFASRMLIYSINIQKADSPSKNDIERYLRTNHGTGTFATAQ